MPRLTAIQRERAAASNASLVRVVVEEACNCGRLAVLEAVLAPTLAHLRDLLAGFRIAVPDAHWTIVEQIAAGESVMTRLSVRGTFSGVLVRLAPPGRPAAVTGVLISRFAEGRLVDLWLQADLLGFLQQLGVMPPLDLTQAVSVAQVLRTGVLLAGEQAPPACPTVSSSRATGPPKGRRTRFGDDLDKETPV
jgi:predicted ester cyclase